MPIIAEAAYANLARADRRGAFVLVRLHLGESVVSRIAHCQSTLVITAEEGVRDTLEYTQASFQVIPV